MLATIDYEASVESIFDDLQQLEEEDQAGRAEQHGAGDLLSDAEGSLHPSKVTQRNGAKASRLFHVTATLVKAF
jgi:hypothetical protein